jgi:hypothetical protein
LQKIISFRLAQSLDDCQQVPSSDVPVDETNLANGSYHHPNKIVPDKRVIGMWLFATRFDSGQTRRHVLVYAIKQSEILTNWVNGST